MSLGLLLSGQILLIVATRQAESKDSLRFALVEEVLREEYSVMM